MLREQSCSSCNAASRAWRFLGASIMRPIRCPKIFSTGSIVDMSDERTGQTLCTTLFWRKKFGWFWRYVFWHCHPRPVVLAPNLTQEMHGKMPRHIIHVKVTYKVSLYITTRSVAIGPRVLTSPKGPGWKPMFDLYIEIWWKWHVDQLTLMLIFNPLKVPQSQKSNHLQKNGHIVILWNSKLFKCSRSFVMTPQTQFP